MSADEASGAETPRSAREARAWWIVHQWAGLKLSLLTSFVLLTGTLAVFAEEMDWLIRPAMRVDPATVGEQPDFAAVAAAVAAHAPEREIIVIHAPADRGFAAVAEVATPGGERRYVYAHPATGAVQGEGSRIGARQVLRDMHRRLMLPRELGLPIVGSMAALLLVSLATSLVVYKKWWRGFLRLPRARDARTWMGDFHRLAGVWSLWFAVIMIATGIWYLVEELGGQAPPLPTVAIPGVEAPAGELATLLPASLAAARRAFPELEVKTVRFPRASALGAFQIEGDAEAVLVRAHANAVWIDARTGEARLVRDARDLGVHQRIAATADPLHFGDFGGLASKIVWFAFGAMLTALSISGAAVYALRLLRRDGRAGRIGAVAAVAWRGMGMWRWPAAALVALGVIGLFPVVLVAAWG